GAELGEGHPAERRRDERGDLDDPQAAEGSVMIGREHAITMQWGPARHAWPGPTRSRCPRLRANSAVRALRVPRGGLGKLLHDGAGVRRVDDVPAADVHRHVALPVVEDEVTG